MSGLGYIMDSYKHFLFNNKDINARNKELYGNLITYIDSMFKIRESKDRTEAGMLKEKLANENVVAMKSRLLGKTEELMTA